MKSTRNWLLGLAALLALMVFTFLFLNWATAWAVGTENLAVNVLDSQGLVKEIDGQAALSFYDEYKVRLINHNDRKATAKVFIDGVPVSKLGDIIIPANGKVDLERFLTHSLTGGAKFKFVPLSDKRVDDPGREENGLVRVEFKLERIPEPVQLNDHNVPTLPWWYNLRTIPSNTIGTLATDSSVAYTVSTTSSSLEKGATIGGGNSDQKFQYAHVDLEDKVIVLELKLKGYSRVGLIK
jgi:hypothetical protein